MNSDRLIVFQHLTDSGDLIWWHPDLPEDDAPAAHDGARWLAKHLGYLRYRDALEGEAKNVHLACGELEQPYAGKSDHLI